MPQLNFIDKKKKPPTPVPVPPATPNVMLNLHAGDLKTNIQGISAIVTRDNQLIQHFDLDKVVAWKRELNILTISLEDNAIPLILNFVSEFDAQSAEGRLTDILNGKLIL